MAQTPDGMLWLATASTLYTFDGIGFEAVTLPDGADRLKRIEQLAVSPGGEMWITDVVGGLFVLAQGRMRDVSPVAERGIYIRSLAFEREGAAWIATSVGLMRHDGRGWRRFDGTDGKRAAQVRSVLVDQAGEVWSAWDDGVFRLDRASGSLRRASPAGGEGSLLQAPDGTIWLTTDDSRTPISPAPTPLAPPPERRPGSSASNLAGLFDRNGNQWSTQCGPGICFTPRDATRTATGARWQQAAQRQDQAWQLSSLAVNGVLEDLEGNIWLATQNGIDRFRANKVFAAPIPGERGMYSMARDTEGNTWVAEPMSGTAWQLRAGHPAVADRTEKFTTVANDRDGALLLAGKRHLVRRAHGKETRLPLPPGRDGKPADLSVFGVLDDGKVLWIGASEVGLMGYADGEWKPRSAFNLPAQIFVSAKGPRPGTLWLGCGDGSVVFYDNGRLTRHDGNLVGVFAAIHPGPELVIAGDKGLAVLQGAGFVMLRAAEPAVLQGVSGLEVAANGDRWLNGARGIVHITSADWRAALASPGRPLRYRLIDSQDGYPGSAMLENRLHSIFVAADGQYWFMASGGLVRLDPANVPRNGLRPQARVASVTAAGVTYPASETVVLPAGVQGFQVTFTAPSLGRPDGIRFNYRLDGVDADWQEGGARRNARYTNVAPGVYRFAVRASNEDGVASAHEAELAVRVTPTLTQTTWFRAAAGLLGAALLYLLYRYRMQRATRRTAERMNMMLAERERIARTLHDTFLQSVQAIILRVHSAAMELPRDSSARVKLEAALDQADAALEEGRDQVHQLREGCDIVQVLESEGQALYGQHPGIRFSLAVSGAVRKLHAQLSEEAVEVCREALRNAYQHSCAAQVSACIEFGESDFVARISDDGIGLTESVARARADAGRWGLLGMRERAARIGAALVIESGAGKGTAVELRVPASLAYIDQVAELPQFTGQPDASSRPDND